jgi:hypothetical protein
VVDQLHESGASIHRRRRRRRAAITLTLVALVLLGTFTYAAAYFQGWVGTRAPKIASPSCQAATPAEALTPRAVTVNVYNSTDRAGLAASVAKSLRTQSFKVVAVANDPLGKPLSGVGEIRHGPAGEAGAALVAARLTGAKLVLDSRTDATVDLVLGKTFKVLSVPPKVAPRKPSKPTPSSSPPC